MKSSATPSLTVTCVFPLGLISSPALANVTWGVGEPTNGTGILKSSPARTTISFG